MFTISFTCFILYQKPKKISYQFYFTLLLSLLALLLSAWVPMRTPSFVTLQVKTIVSLFELQLVHLPPRQSLMKLNLLYSKKIREQFFGVGEDVASHLNIFFELCDIQKYKEVDDDIFKL